MKQKICILLTSLFIFTTIIRTIEYQNINLSTVDIFPYVITEPGDYLIKDAYTFTDPIPIPLAIRIDADNVTLNGASHVIDGNNYLDTFLKVTNRDNVLVQGVSVIQTNKEAFIVDNSSHVSLLDIAAETDNDTELLYVANSDSILLNVSRFYGKGIRNVHFYNTTNIHIVSSDFSAHNEQIAQQGVTVESCSHVIIEGSRSIGNNIGFVIDSSQDVVLNGCQALQCLQDGFLCRQTHSENNKITFSGCIATGNNQHGFDVLGTNVRFLESQSQLNIVNGFVLDGRNHELKECVSFKNGSYGISIKSTAEDILIRNLKDMHNTVNNIDNKGKNVRICSIDLVHNDVMVVCEKVENVLGSRIDGLADLSSFNQENLTVSLPEYEVSTGLNSQEHTITSWEKLLYDRLLRLEFKVNQILNNTTVS